MELAPKMSAEVFTRRMFLQGVEAFHAPASKEAEEDKARVIAALCWDKSKLLRNSAWLRARCYADPGPPSLLLQLFHLVSDLLLRVFDSCLQSRIILPWGGSSPSSNFLDFLGVILKTSAEGTG